MQTLIIYDNDGYIIQNITGSYRVPAGIPYLEISIPEGKRLKNGIGVDVSVTPNQAILEDVPPTETQLLQQKIDTMQAALDEIILGGL